MAFYKLEYTESTEINLGKRVNCAANFVHMPGNDGEIISICAAFKDAYTYPVLGWYWFDSHEQACAHFGVDLATQTHLI